MPCYNNILVKTLMLSQLNRNARYRHTTKPCFLLFLLFIFIRVPVPRVDRGNVRLSQVRVRVAVVSRRGSMSFSHYIMHIIINNNMCRSVFVRFQEAFSLWAVSPSFSLSPARPRSSICLVLRFPVSECRVYQENNVYRARAVHPL